MDASSASWTRIPRDYHEQQRLQLEHRLFASTAHSNELSDDHSSFNLEEEDLNNDLNNRDAYNSEGDEGRRSSLRYSSSEFSMEYPRNPQIAADDFSLSNPHRHRRSQPREGDTKSTFAHHASAVTFRTGLRGTRDSRDFSRGLSDLSAIDYDPDRPLDALLRRASDLSILQDSPRDAPKSEFTTRAQGLAKQMTENSNSNSQQPSASNNKNSSFGAANATLKPVHKPLSELARNANTPLKPTFQTTRLFPAYTQTTGRIQLPDVTGLTSAVATPLKGDASFRRVPDPKPSSSAFASRFRNQPVPTSSKPTTSSFHPEKHSQPTTAPANVNPAAALDTLSHRLQQIERESLTSRRRVSELERELDMCRGVVDLERSRMGELSARSMRMGTSRRREHRSFSVDGKPTRGKGNVDEGLEEVDAVALDASFRETQRRYREAVGEEKELEALVKALHSHLRRTSQTVESHKQMINELRAEAQQTRASRRSSSLLHSDAQEVGKIWDEVEHVKSEVELLWGDVGRLRGVVEGGLGLRRARGGRIGHPADGGDVVVGSVVRGDSLRDMSEHDDDVSDAEEGREEEPQDEPQQEQEQEEDYEEDFRPQWAPRKPGEPVLSAVLEEDEPASTRASGRSITPHPHSAPTITTTGRFIQDAELERVRAEVEERRSLRSMSMSGSGSDRSGATALGVHSRALGRVLDTDGGRVSPVPTSRVASSSKVPTGARHGLQQHTPPRPLTPDSEGDARVSTPEQPQQDQQQQQQRTASPSAPTALPQIRGERLERLFYATPEHNSRTCGVCHRRRRAEGHKGHTRSSSGSLSVPVLPAGAEEVKFGEGDEHRIAEIARKSGVPPQTVLARVLRELEDDFTHYKSIYVELADQYKAMDAASDMGKRNLLANHLREVIDVLEQKGDQIASLYDLLHFEDKPLAAPKASSSQHHYHHKHDHTHSRRTRLS